MFNSNTWPKSGILWHIGIENMVTLIFAAIIYGSNTIIVALVPEQKKVKMLLYQDKNL